MNCATMTERAPECTEDAFLGGRLRLRQLKSGHRAGHDAMLLAAAVSARPGARVLDFGAGVGAAGLALARRVEGINLALVEIDAMPDMGAEGDAFPGLVSTPGHNAIPGLEADGQANDAFDVAAHQCGVVQTARR